VTFGCFLSYRAKDGAAIRRNKQLQDYVEKVTEDCRKLKAELHEAKVNKVSVIDVCVVVIHTAEQPSPYRTE